MTTATATAAVEGTCYECGEECDRPFVSHPACCPHDEDITPDVTGPVESRDSGTCDDCGAHVHAESDVDGDSDGFFTTTVWVAD